jgi:hypothetical protein
MQLVNTSLQKITISLQIIQFRKAITFKYGTIV